MQFFNIFCRSSARLNNTMMTSHFLQNTKIKFGVFVSIPQSSGWRDIVVPVRIGGRLTYFAECISLKPLDGFTPFEVLWDCLDLKLCNVMVIRPCYPYGLAHGPKTSQTWHRGPDFTEQTYPKLLDGFTPFEVLRNCQSFVASSWAYHLGIGFFKVCCWKSRISGIRGPIETEQKGCESMGRETHFVTLNFDLSHDANLEVIWSKYEKAVFQEWRVG